MMFAWWMGNSLGGLCQMWMRNSLGEYNVRSVDGMFTWWFGWEVNGRFASYFKVIVYLLIILFNYVFQSIYYIYCQYCFLQKNHTAIPLFKPCMNINCILFFPTTCWVLYVLTALNFAAQLKSIKLIKSSTKRSPLKVLRIRMCSPLDCLWVCWLAFPSFLFRCKSLFVSLALRGKLSKSWP